MPSFASLMSYAFLGLAAFSAVQAAPIAETQLIEARCGCESDSDSGYTGATTTVIGLPSIVASLSADLNPIIGGLGTLFLRPDLSVLSTNQKLSVYGTSANITVDVVTDVVAQCKTVISAAITDVQALSGESVDVVLAAGADVVLSVSDFAAQLCVLVTVRAHSFS